MERWMGDDKIPILVCVFLYMSCEGEKLLLDAWRFMLIFSNRKGFTTRGCVLCILCVWVYISVCIGPDYVFLVMLKQRASTGKQ